MQKKVNQQIKYYFSARRASRANIPSPFDHCGGSIRFWKDNDCQRISKRYGEHETDDLCTYDAPCPDPLKLFLEVYSGKN
jgi:hypothetical protein